MATYPAFQLNIKLSAEGKSLFIRLARLLGRDELQRALLRFFDTVGPHVAGYIAKNKLSGQLLRVRSGDLRRALWGKGQMYQGEASLALGILGGSPARVYAAIQELGTRDLNPESPFPVIRPKKGKALAFPPEGSPALTKSGVPRVDGPREYEERFNTELAFVPFRSGIALGALYDKKQMKAQRRRGQRISLRNLKTVYLLLKQSSIPPHHYLREGLLEQLAYIGEALVNFLRDYLNGRQQSTK